MGDFATRWRVQVTPLFGSGDTEEMELEFTQQQLEDWLAGTHIQNAMPHLTPAQREFILSGMTPEKWDRMWEED